MKTSSKNKGVYGNRVKVEPEQVDAMLRTENEMFTQIGKVVGVGPQSTLKVGDRIVFVEWRSAKVLLNEKTYYYTMDDPNYILEVL